MEPGQVNKFRILLSLHPVVKELKDVIILLASEVSKGANVEGKVRELYHHTCSTRTCTWINYKSCNY